MPQKVETEVLVVGAGPVGLFSALLLAQRGIDVMVIDKKWRPATQSYALMLHGETLELLSEVGLADSLLAGGHRIDKVTFWRGNSQLGQLDVTPKDGRPPVVVVPQAVLEQAIEKRLKELKLKVHWSHGAAYLETNGYRVRASINEYEPMSAGYPFARMESVVKRELDVTAKFTVGTDGYYSYVRDRMKVDYQKLSDPFYFSVFEFRTDEIYPHEVRVVMDDDRTSALWPITSNRARFNFQIAGEEEHEPSLERFAELARARAPWFNLKPVELNWSTMVLFERRLVDCFGKNRMYLAGDSAHITGPVGAQSMNVGMRESAHLVSLLGDFLRNNAPIERLEAYQASRAAEWGTLLEVKGGVKATSSTPAWAKGLTSRIMTSIPASGAELNRVLSQLGLETF